eukprot:gene65218-89229_t
MVVGKAACVKRKFDMKKFLIPLLAASALAGAAVPAAAAPWMNINERQAQLDQRIDAGMHFRDDLVERRVGRQRVADDRDIDAVRHRTGRETGEEVLRAHLP